MDGPRERSGELSLMFPLLAVVPGLLKESSVVMGSVSAAQLGARGMWMESCC